jgi:Secretion system C-terminal sorting domain
MNPLKIIGLITYLLITVPAINAQTVWPGDVNNNGIVNNVDYLYWGYAIGMIGPPRLPGEQGIDFEAKNIDTPWGVNLPGTTLDASFADCNGNGFVGDIEDEAAIIYENYGQTHDVVNPEDIEIGTPGVDPPLFFETDFQDYYIEGTVGALLIQLGTTDQVVDNFQGIAFTVRYDPDILGDDLVEVAFEGPWFSDIPLMMFNNDPINGIIEVAISRLSPEPIDNAFGPIATLFFIIEDDVVSMDQQEVETVFYIEKITMFDDEFNVAPVVSDSMVITIVQDPLSNKNPIEEFEIDVFPNPVSDQLFIESPHEIEEVMLYNALGQLVLRQSFQNENSVSLQLENMVSGIYFVKIKTPQGIITRKILVSKANK